MQMHKLPAAWRRALWLSATAAAAACSGGGDGGPVESQPDASQPLAINLEASSLTARLGDKVAIAVKADPRSTTALQALQGTLVYSGAALKYVGQQRAADTRFLLVNDAAADRGELRFIALDAKAGLPGRVATFVFEVRGGDYLKGMAFKLEGAGNLKQQFTRAQIAPLPALAADLSTASYERPDFAEATQRWAPAEFAAEASRLTRQANGSQAINFRAGQIVSDLKYGDVTVNGSVNAFDVAYLANASIGLATLLPSVNGGAEDTRDPVLAGNVAPLNGGATATGNPGSPNCVAGNTSGCRPGVTPNNATNSWGIIDVFDVLAVANAGVGNSNPPVGSIIPGRGAADINPGSKPRVVVTSDITTNTTWTNDKIWQICDGSCGGGTQTDVSGIIHVTNGATLTIQPGTQVEGFGGTITAGTGVGVGQGVLEVERDGFIVADGTALQPIVFTCVTPTQAGPKGEPAGTRYPGCWGGLYLLGNATINSDLSTSSAVTCGGGRAGSGSGIQEQDELNFIAGPPTFGRYGGCNDADSSGVLRYVRSEFGGGRVSGTKERNGITFDAVGNKTVVDYIEAYASLDDGMEFFGGTVNVKHFVSVGNEDDHFDYVLGYRGKVQFGLVLEDSTNSDRCVEGDNNGVDAGSPEALPRSAPQMYNITCVGRIAARKYANFAATGTTCNGQFNNTGGTDVNCGREAVILRQGTDGTFRNFLIYGFGEGVRFNIPGTGLVPSPNGLCNQINAGTLSFRNSVVATGPLNSSTFGTNPTPWTTAGSQPFDAGSAGTTWSCGGANGTNGTYAAQNLMTQQYFANPANAITFFQDTTGTGSIAPSNIFVDGTNLAYPDFRVKSSSPVASLTGATPPADGFFDASATYIGALPPANGSFSNIPWYAGWARFFPAPTTTFTAAGATTVNGKVNIAKGP